MSWMLVHCCQHEEGKGKEINVEFCSWALQVEGGGDLPMHASHNYTILQQVQVLGLKHFPNTVKKYCSKKSNTNEGTEGEKRDRISR